MIKNTTQKNTKQTTKQSNTKRPLELLLHLLPTTSKYNVNWLHLYIEKRKAYRQCLGLIGISGRNTDPCLRWGKFWVLGFWGEDKRWRGRQQCFATERKGLCCQRKTSSFTCHWCWRSGEVPFPKEWDRPSSCPAQGPTAVAQLQWGGGWPALFPWLGLFTPATHDVTWTLPVGLLSSLIYNASVDLLTSTGGVGNYGSASETRVERNIRKQASDCWWELKMEKN